jgi:hypothetical protein
MLIIIKVLLPSIGYGRSFTRGGVPVDFGFLKTIDTLIRLRVTLEAGQDLIDLD